MFSSFFIRHPNLTIVISILIVMAGLISMYALPISQYPLIAPIQIQVTTTYPGADAETVADSVAAPIEAQINGVDNMLYMTSTSSNTGQMTITVYFSLDSNPDIAQVLVQNRVNLAMAQLPLAVQQYGVSVQKRSSSTLMLIAIYGEENYYDADYVRNYTNIYVLDEIKRVKGAGQAQIFGVPDQAMRIWMNPDKMASLGITTSDIQGAIVNQNSLVGAGQIGQEPTKKETQLNFPVVTQRPFTQAAEYEKIILRGEEKSSAIVRLGDVARAEVGRKAYIDDNRLNGLHTTPIIVYQQAGANGLEVSAAIRKTMEKLKQSMPEGINYLIALDTTDFVRLSIEEVMKTLIEAGFLVVLVVYLFLQNGRATIICCIAIIVSLVGTFTGMIAFGFSINLLTLFGLVLAIGMVVDDAIVVVENVERNLMEGRSIKNACIQAMEEVTTPVIAVVFSLSAVFIPAAFLPGTTGQLYKQFALTIVISVGISGFVALTLTPVLCSLLMVRHVLPTKGFFAAFNRLFNRLTDRYGRWVEIVIRRSAISLVLFGAFFFLILDLFHRLPTSFVPNEDQGYLLGQVMMPDSSSLQRTVETSQRIDELFAKNPAVQNRTVVNGYSLIDGQYQPNAATLFITLKDFKERYHSIKSALQENVAAVLLDVYHQSKEVVSGFFLPIAPPAIPGIGTTGGVECWIQDFQGTGAVNLYEMVDRFLEKVRLRPEIATINTTFRASSLQYKVDVDREMATLLSLPIEDINNALQAQFGSLTVSQYEESSHLWNVILQSDARYRGQPSDINRLYTRSKNGDMIPLTAVVKTSYTNGSNLIPHFNGFPAAQLTAKVAASYSSGDAILAIEQVAKEVLPPGYGLSWSGLALQEKHSQGSSAIAFVFGTLIVFLILAAQYESWSLPFAVLTAIPFGVFGALLATNLRGLENDIYFQIGLLVLVGLAAKNAILIVEFATVLREAGKGATESAIEAGRLRLRPIIMTSLAFIVGVLPLFFAMGVGANARHSIGTGMVGGMIGASTLALLYVPLFFCLFDHLGKWFTSRKVNQQDTSCANESGH